MKLDSGNFFGADNREKQEVTDRREKRKKTFDDYAGHFQLREEELMRGKEILDVGAGELAAFADHTRVMDMNCRVISLDKNKFLDVSADGIDQKDNLKIGEFDFGKESLGKRLGMSREPEFDLILSHRSAPFMIGREKEGIKVDERGVALENFELIRNKMAELILAAMKHLKKGGRAMFYPISKSVVVEGGGRRRDFRGWRKILEETLRTLVRKEEGYISLLEDMPPERGIDYQRLTIIRTF